MNEVMEYGLWTNRPKKEAYKYIKWVILRTAWLRGSSLDESTERFRRKRLKVWGMWFWGYSYNIKGVYLHGFPWNNPEANAMHRPTLYDWVKAKSYLERWDRYSK